MSASVVSISRVSKHFDSVIAVDDISFDVAAQSTTALLGGNGAGKTTTLSMLLGLLLPTAGSVRVRRGHAAPPLPRAAAPEFFLALCRSAAPPHGARKPHGLRAAVRHYRHPRAHRALSEELQIGRFLNRAYGQLSAGEKTRVVLAKALLNEPELMLLDEPTASLDPDTADYVRGMLEAYRKRTGTTILLASHNMSEVERLCDDVIMLRAGKVVDRGTPAQLLARYGRHNMEEVFIDIARERGSIWPRPTGRRRSHERHRARPYRRFVPSLRGFTRWCCAYLSAAQLRAAHPGAGVLADGADDPVGIHHDVPHQSQLLDRAGLGRAALGGAVVGRAVPRPARRVAGVHGGDVVAQPRDICS
jgi:ABC-2 type transport system ATP-binding protein